MSEVNVGTNAADYATEGSQRVGGSISAPVPVPPASDSAGNSSAPTPTSEGKAVRDMEFPTGRIYTSSHSWLALPPGQALSDYPLRAGITTTALDGLDVVGLDLPAVRSTVNAGAPCALIWSSSRTVVTMYAPLSGLVTMTNIAAIEDPQLVARDPHYAGWLFAILPIPTSSTNDLLAPAQYKTELSAAV
ncbi:glycine cleavage system protein H [Rhodococcus sp. NPDC056960]|uniref:glycine cleavage system protein H n=1 Tax=Rhodococcus sp. NPDC056960 TaxID=3345982 RepID=UPI00362AD7F6